MRSDLLNRQVRWIPTWPLAQDLPPSTATGCSCSRCMLNLIMNGCDAMDAFAERPVAARHDPVGRGRIGVADRGSAYRRAPGAPHLEPFVTTKAQ